MKKYFALLSTLFFALTIFTPAIVSAHQPQLVTAHPVVVIDPEVSKAYYDTLRGSPAIYTIVSDKPFALYVNTLVPAVPGQEKLITATVAKNGQTIATLDGITYAWKTFFEPFGHDTYWMGPEYKADVTAGTYTITVSSPRNDSKYSLAIGETEAFDMQTGWAAMHVIPALKRDFFGKSPIDFILSPFGFGYIIFLFILAFAFGFLYRFILKKFTTSTVRKVEHNINKTDRSLRAVIGVALFVFAITTSWSAWLIFFAGFCFFEAIFSWCGFYAAIGKNTCPL
jgi:hypothetical protein